MRITRLVRICVVLGALACSDGTGARGGPRPQTSSSTPKGSLAGAATGVAEPQMPQAIAIEVAAPDAASLQSGAFVALTYNVAGLPEPLSRSRPSVYTPLIGRRLNRYDLVLVQESWQTPSPNPAAPLRGYHELLVSTAQHRYKTPCAPQPFGTDPRRPSALLADGLNLFSKLPLAVTTRIPWNRCVDTFYDCHALKGFSMTPLELAPGAIVHVYNLHMEAGWSAEDDDARDAAIDQLLAFIDLHSRGRALIVGGDFNLRGERERATVQLAKLRKGAGLSDACLDCARPRNVDKLLYRGDDHLRLEAQSWRLETDVFVSEAGAPLSDHAPLAVRFAWSRREGPEPSDDESRPH